MRSPMMPPTSAPKSMPTLYSELNTAAMLLSAHPISISWAWTRPDIPLLQANKMPSPVMAKTFQCHAVLGSRSRRAPQFGFFNSAMQVPPIRFMTDTVYTAWARCHVACPYGRLATRIRMLGCPKFSLRQQYTKNLFCTEKSVKKRLICTNRKNRCGSEAK